MVNIRQEITGVKHTNQLDLFKSETVDYKNYKGDTSICKVCDLEKPVSHFYKMGITEFVRSICISCFKKDQQFRNREREKNLHLNTGYCDCCGIKEDPLCFDHCHDSLEFRGFICRSCNLGLGKLGDNIEGLEKALIYLKKYYETER